MIHEHDKPIHEWFSLSYSTHLVLDPTVTGHLPKDWHNQMGRMLDELDRSFPDVNRDGITALALAGAEWCCGDLDTEQLHAIDMTTDRADFNDHTGCGAEHEDEPNENWWGEREQTRWHDWRGDEFERDDRVVVPVETEQQARAAGRRVVPRTLLQSMPAEWQARFVRLLEQVDNVDAVRPESYDIRFYTTGGVRTTDPVPHYRRGRTRLVPAMIP